MFSLDVAQFLLAAGVVELGIALALWDWSRVRPQAGSNVRDGGSSTRAKAWLPQPRAGSLFSIFW
jgi:hypothetical protein